MLYLDNLSSMPVRTEVREAMFPFLGEHCGNPSSLHTSGQIAREALEKARTLVANLFGAHHNEVYFAPSATQANNTAILGRARFCQANNLGRHAVISSFEPSSISEAFKYLENECQWQVTRIAPPTGNWHITAGSLAAAVTSQTSIIAISAIDIASGALQPLAELAEVAGSHKAFFHCDASLSAGRESLSELPGGVSSVSISGHLLGATKGCGALYLRRGSSLMPAVFGGGQEMGYFPGTERVADIVGLGVAAEIVRMEMLSNGREVLESLALCVLNGLEIAPGWSWLGPLPGGQRLAGHVSLSPESGTDAAAIYSALCESGIALQQHRDKLILQFDTHHSPTDVRFLLGQINKASLSKRE